MTDIPQPRPVALAAKTYLANSKESLELRLHFRVFFDQCVGLVRALLKETASFW